MLFAAAALPANHGLTALVYLKLPEEVEVATAGSKSMLKRYSASMLEHCNGNSILHVRYGKVCKYSRTVDGDSRALLASACSRCRSNESSTTDADRLLPAWWCTSADSGAAIESDRLCSL